MSEEDVLKLKSYKIYTNKLIGKGQFGNVYECDDLDNPKLRLCSKIIQDKLDDPKTLREIELMKLIMTSAKGNKNIVGVEYVDFNKERIVLIMEKCECDLQSIIDRKKKFESKNFTPIEALNVLKQVVHGYRVLFSNNIIHRDLKPANILFLDGIYKIADLGLARIMENVDGKDLTKVGTPKYVAPQLYIDNFFSNQADVFSLGIIIYELIFGGLPYTANSQVQIRKALRNLEKNPVIVSREVTGMSNDFAELIEYMLKFKENERISWEQLFKHPLISDETGAVVNRSGLIMDTADDQDSDEETTQETIQEQQVPVQEQQVKAAETSQPEKKEAAKFAPQAQPPFPIAQTSSINKTALNSAVFQPPHQPVPAKFLNAFPNGATSTIVNPNQTLNNTFVPPNQPFSKTTQNQPQRFQTGVAQPVIGQNFTYQQPYSQSEQMFQIGLLMDWLLELMEKFQNMQYQLRAEIFGVKLYCHCLSQCFFEHVKNLKTLQPQNNTSQKIYNDQTLEQELQKQQKYHLVISQEIERYNQGLAYPVQAIQPDYNIYFQKLNKITSARGLFLYASDRKYFMDYLQMLFTFEKLKEYQYTKIQDLYLIYSDINRNLKNESAITEYLNKKIYN